MDGGRAVRVPSVLVDAGLAKADAWLAVDRSTLETTHPGVYGIGDCTAIGLANAMPLPKAGAFAEAEALAVAARIAAAFRGDPRIATIEGRGACYMEMGDGEASVIGGDMYADPPDVTLSVPSAAQRAAKEQFEMERLARWFDR
jgi:sulfide:quinone oxidoreductase